MSMKSALLGAAMLVSLAAVPAQAATLFGDTATGSILFGAITAQGPLNAVIGAGLEFDFANADINVAASSIAISNIATGTLVPNETYRVTGLDFTDIASTIVGLTLTGSGGISIAAVLAFTSNSVSITLLSGTNVSAGAFVNVNILSSPSAVPLPAALPLLAAGLGMIGAVGWRRKRNAIAA